MAARFRCAGLGSIQPAIGWTPSVQAQSPYRISAGGSAYLAGKLIQKVTMRGLCTWLCVGAMVSLGLTGCGDTADQISVMDQDLAKRRTEAAAVLADRLIKDPNLQQAGDVQLYVSSNLVSQALTLFDKLSVTDPDMPDVTFTVNSIRPVFTEGIASLELDLSAKKGDLTIQVKGTATLLPESLPDAKVEKQIVAKVSPIPDEISRFLGINPIQISVPLYTQVYKQRQPLRFRIVVDQLVPRASWGPFSSDIKGFVADLARLKLNALITAKLPAIEVPLQNVIAIKQDREVKPLDLMDGKLKAELITPPAAWSTSFSLTEVVVLKRGIHLIGALSNPGAVE